MAMAIATLSSIVGVIGDVHAEDELLQEALTCLADQGVESILCVGDIVDGKGSAERCCALLAEYGVSTVRGNHDRWLAANSMRQLSDATRRSELSPASLEFLDRLPKTRLFASPLGGVLLCHGLGANDMACAPTDASGYDFDANDELQELLHNPDVAVLLNGHTHAAVVQHFAELTAAVAGRRSFIEARVPSRR
jgi:predicted phosphodiesterase